VRAPEEDDCSVRHLGRTSAKEHGGGGSKQLEEHTHRESADRRTADRRRHRSRFVLHERRAGFDRRRSDSVSPLTSAFRQTLLGLRDRPRLLDVLLLTVNLLNLADFALTLQALQDGGAETNPVMRSLFAAHPVYAGLFKILAVLFVSLVLWRWRSFRDALQAALVMLALFMAVLLYHVGGLVVFA
jgi:hypothetical protein